MGDGGQTENRKKHNENKATKQPNGTECALSKNGLLLRTDTFVSNQPSQQPPDATPPQISRAAATNRTLALPRCFAKSGNGAVPEGCVCFTCVSACFFHPFFFSLLCCPCLFAGALICCAVCCVQLFLFCLWFAFLLQDRFPSIACFQSVFPIPFCRVGRSSNTHTHTQSEDSELRCFFVVF